MGGDIYLPFGKALFLGKELGLPADCNQADHCPVNKITFVPHLNGMFKETLSLRASMVQGRAFKVCLLGGPCSPERLGYSVVRSKSNGWSVFTHDKVKN